MTRKRYSSLLQKSLNILCTTLQNSDIRNSFLLITIFNFSIIKIATMSEFNVIRGFIYQVPYYGIPVPVSPFAVGGVDRGRSLGGS